MLSVLYTYTILPIIPQENWKKKSGSSVLVPRMPYKSIFSPFSPSETLFQIDGPQEKPTIEYTGAATL